MSQADIIQEDSFELKKSASEILTFTLSNTLITHKDVDFEYNRIVVRDGKGQKDRVIMLPNVLKASLKKQLEKVNVLRQIDLEI